MRIVSAQLSGFRNLAADNLAFSPRVNVVLGRNGEGKTNLLEALNYFALGRSHRGSRNEELIAFDGEALHVSLEVEEDTGGLVTCEYALDRHGERRLRVDGEPVRRRADLVGRLATVFFNPDTIRLVRGAPQRRRHFADQGLSETDPAYLVHLTAFQRALKQKASLLRDLRKGLVDHVRARDDLTAWNREIAHHAAAVCRGRAEYATQITPCADAAHRELAQVEAPLVFAYRPRLETVAAALAAAGDGDAGKTSKIDALEQDIFQEMSYIVGSEIRRGRPLLGPQLDDFEVRLGGPAGLDLRTFGSQGETRSAAIALILARSDVLHSRRRVRPVLFLDDIFSELDPERSRRLQEMTARLHQVFIASARPDDVVGWHPPELRRWQVEDGRISATADDPATE